MRLLIVIQETMVDKEIKVMITDSESMYDLLDQSKFISFLQAITSLSFSPSVILALPSQVQQREVSYGF